MSKSKLAPPPKKADVVESPASSRLSATDETKAVLIRVSPQLHSDIKGKAARKGVSIKSYILGLVEDDLKKI